ncbi:MAG: VCBS repeat-containing protein, partial [Rhodothermaceae bacterium]|nr:VCBS repeat-containing protein [Rhodothermaceae bacterium]
SNSGLDYQHREDVYSDWDIHPLLPRDLAQEGPALTSGDVNGDNLIDIFLGGARGQAAKLYLQQLDGSYVGVELPVFEQHAAYEDVDAVFADFSGDGASDLYVVSGGGPDPKYWQDRLYINTGFGNLSHTPDLLPPMHTVTSAVAPNDIDGDGDIDLFIGGLHIPGEFGKAPRSYLLENTPQGFRDQTATWAPELQNPGMLTTAVWADVHGDERMELLIAGHWMTIRVFCMRESTILDECTASLGLADQNGLWNQIVPADLDMDGDIDLIAGNRGWNAQIQISRDNPATLYVGDLDRSGTWDVIYSGFVKGLEVPIASRDQMVAQLPDLRLRFPTYSDYAAATTNDIMSGYDESTTSLKASNTASVVFELTEGSTFEPRPLPLAAQFAPVRDALVMDVNQDEHVDILLVGNDYSNRAEEGRMSSGRGLILSGDGAFSFQEMKTGDLWMRGDARRLIRVNNRVIVANNNSPLDIFLIPEGAGYNP